MNIIAILLAGLGESQKQAIEKMKETEGLYVGGDLKDPTAMVPMISKGGKLYAVQIEEQPLDEEGFLPTLTVHGPYHPQPPATVQVLQDTGQVLFDALGAKEEDMLACPHCMAVRLAEEVMTLRAIKANLHEVPVSKKEMH